ncbi:MAG: TIGR02921 family PEP-CTERM protein [Leptolyngbyaceae cyanobacterium]|mgnify:CR=1 FL=1
MIIFESLKTLGNSALQRVRKTPPKRLARGLLNLSFHSIFWGWNGLFLMVVYLGFLPFIGVPLIAAMAAGEVPFPFVVPLMAFLAVPPVCTVVGLIRFRKHADKLMRLFYSVEAPIMALSIFRMFVLRELTSASTLMVVAGAIAIATITLELLFGYSAYNKGLARFQMAAQTVVLLAGLYVGGVLLFYTVPLVWILLGAFLRFEWVGAIIQELSWSWQLYQPQGLLDFIEFIVFGSFQSLLVLGIFALFAFSATLFVGLPYALVIMFSQSWARIRYAFGQQFGTWQSWATTGTVVLTLGSLFLLTSPQPQTWAFEQLSQAPESAAERQALVEKSPQIRRGLLNAHLMQYRYISSWQSANNLEAWYPDIFPITREQAGMFQLWHNALLSPFLYQGDRTDPNKAATLYAEFFDAPLQKAESDAIKHALQSTVERDSVEASLLNINDRIVALTKQEVTVEPAGDWAKVNLYERYENNTREDQEIVYQFSLPESAAFTELWLGEEGLAERYRFVVSPRGAAQQVYNAERERAEFVRAEDPALLEQVGPRQYRLRVFPIPQREGPGRPGITHLWMSYEVAQQEGGWPLPQLTEKRNLYWTSQTERLRAGQKPQDFGDVWYEAAIPADTPVAPQAHQATLAAGYTVTAAPMTTTATPKLVDQRLAAVVDTSRSMGDRTADLTQAFKELAALAPSNTLDWYVTSEDGMPPVKLEQAPKVQDLSFYGSLPLTDQLNQWAQLRQAAQYDAVFVLTDAGNYELETDAAAVPELSGSLWLVHLDGQVPTAYTDALQQRLTDSQGGVTSTIASAISRFAVEQQADATVMDGYRWAIAPASPTAAASNTASDFQALAARQAIRWLSRQQDATQIEVLDKLHGIAKRTEIVTPYSSMLVLVNDRQREALKAAENDLDRFEREVEDSEDTLTNPGDPLNASVPEPGAPLTMLFIGGIMIWLIRRSKR